MKDPTQEQEGRRWWTKQDPVEEKERFQRITAEKSGKTFTSFVSLRRSKRKDKCIYRCIYRLGKERAKPI